MLKEINQYSSHDSIGRMRIILFDLGNTLEFDGELMPGAKELLSSIREMDGYSFAVALVSDFDNFNDRPGELVDVKAKQLEYYEILHKLGISSYFEPLYKHVTLSAEVGVRKPDKRIFLACNRCDRKRFIIGKCYVHYRGFHTYICCSSIRYESNSF